MERSVKILLALTVVTWLESIHSCKQEEVLPLNLISITCSNGVDLTASGALGVVPVNVVITATFTAEIDPNSVSHKTVWLIRDYDQDSIPLTLIVSRAVLTIRSTTNLISGAGYTLTISSSLMSTHGMPFGSSTVLFKTYGTFVPTNQVAWWNFDNNTDDAVGSHDPLTTGIVDIDYKDNTIDSAGTAVVFNGTTSLIEVPGGSSLLGPQFTISFWMFLNNGNVKDNYVLGIGNDHGLQFEVDAGFTSCRFSQGFLLADKISTTTNDFQFFANGATKDNVSDNGIDNATLINQDFGAAGMKQRLDNQWAQIVMTFDDTTKVRSLYINGELMYQQDLKLLSSTNVASELQPLATVVSLKFIPDVKIPPTYDDNLVFGFWQGSTATYSNPPGDPSDLYSNQPADHFNGLLDDVRIFSRALTNTEIQMMYDSEKPVP